LEILNDFLLKEYNSFGLDVKAHRFSTFENIEEFKELLKYNDKKNYPLLVIGNGSNILFTGDFNGLVIHPSMQDIKKVNETKSSIDFKIGAGMIWDEFVSFCVNKNYWGIENLSNIPGTVGSAPIQNIGAYGVEIKNNIQFVEIFDLADKRIKVLNNAACKFGYRSSIFKSELKGQCVVLNVVIRLYKKPNPILSYEKLEEKVLKLGKKNLQNIRNTIIEIRSQKLPAPSEIGNAGSFFKNPVLSNEKSIELQNEFKDIPVYPVDNSVKISAAWLIEKCGWKGYKKGNVGVYKKQSLVLVNHGNAKGHEILELAEKIRESVFEKFKIMLEPEVNVI